MASARDVGARIFHHIRRRRRRRQVDADRAAGRASCAPSATTSWSRASPADRPARKRCAMCSCRAPPSRSGRRWRRCFLPPRAPTMSSRSSGRRSSAAAIVLCDRFLDSSRVYQGVTGDLDPAFMAELERVAINGMMPDMTLIFDIDPAEGPAPRRGAARRRRRPTASRRKRWTSISAAARPFWRSPRSEPDRCIVIDASADPDSVENVVTAAVFAALEARWHADADGARRGLMFERIAPGAARHAGRRSRAVREPAPGRPRRSAASMLAAGLSRRQAAACAAVCRAARHRQGDARLSPRAIIC